MSIEQARERIRKAGDGGHSSLYLGRMGLSELPAEIFHLHDLSRLFIEGNQLTALPPNIGKLSNLEELRADDNQMSILPPEIAGLAGLKSLSLLRNSLVELPAEIGQLDGLEVLVLGHNRLAELPPEIGQLKNLRRLSLEFNQITTLPSETGGLVKLTFLDVRNNNLTSLTSQIGNLQCLQSLILENNQLSRLPSEVGCLTGLKFLNISHNRLVVLPSDIGNAQNLQSLSLHFNQLTKLPSEIGNLLVLTEVNIQNNQVVTLPSEIGNLVRLRSLNLENNSLSKLPSEIGQMTSLESLNLQNNQLTALPPEIGSLQNLELLFVQKNRLTQIPPEFANLSKLKNLRLHDDQLLALPLSARIREWDVFISHASEDKEAVALPLAEALTRAGLKVWIDQQEIQIGDSIRRKIDAGLSKSRYGVVVISQPFMEKVWTQRELNGLMAIEDEGEKVLLPIWHNISRADLNRFSPMLSDIAAANTNDGISVVASQIIDAVLYRADTGSTTLFPSLTRRFVELIRNHNSVTDLREFLFQHHRIIRNAFGRGFREKVTITPILLDRQIPCLFVHFEFSATDIYEKIACLIFASPDTQPLIQSDGFSVAKFARTVLAREPDEWDEAIFIAGRRHELGEVGKARVNDFNYANENMIPKRSANPSTTNPYNRRPNSDVRTFKIRTYDWLIDACVSLEQRK